MKCGISQAVFSYSNSPVNMDKEKVKNLAVVNLKY